MKNPNDQNLIIISAKKLRDMLNYLFEVEQRNVNKIQDDRIDKEIKQESIELKEITKELEKTKKIISIQSKKANKLLNAIKDKIKIIEEKEDELKKFKANKRDIDKIKDCFHAENNLYGNDIEYYYEYENPINQPYLDTRTDLKAHISGTSTTNLVVVEVIKPIIRKKSNKQSVVFQQGIVTVASKDLNKEVNHEKND